MKRDILFGAIIAVLLHFSVALHSHWTKRPVPVIGETSKAEPIPVKLLPEIEIEIDPTVIDDPQPPAPPVPVAIDRPQPIATDDFVIAPDPAKPVITGATFAAYTIPTNDLGASLRQGAFRLNEVDQAPQAVLQVAAPYPATMKAQGVAGEVVVGFIVDANNQVRNVRVLSSSAREFESSAVQAVLKWKFRAGRKGGKPVPVQMEVPIRFQLK